MLRALVCGGVFLALAAAPALAQEGTPSPVQVPEGGPGWTYYMAYGTIAIAGLALLAALAGYLVQSRGWERRESKKGGPAAGGSSG